MNIDNIPAAPQADSTQETSSESTSQDSGQPTEGLNTQAKPKTAPPAEEKYEIKVNGRTMKVTREELMKRAELAEGANQRFQQAAQKEKAATTLMENLKKDPIRALMDPALGLSKDQIRDVFERWYHKDFIEPETLSPEQRKLQEYEEEVKAYRAEKEERARIERERQLEEATSQHTAILQKEIISTLEQGKLPKTPYFVGRIAYYMKQAEDQGFEAPRELILEQIRRERQSQLSDLTENTDVETLIEYLGEGLINKIRKYDLEKLRAARGVAAQSTPQRNETGRFQKTEDFTTMRDVDANLRRMRQGG